MKKLSIFLLAMTMSVSALAGTVNGKITKIRAYERGKTIKFESRIPNLTFRVKKVDILKAMTRYGKITTVADIEKNGIVLDVDRKVFVTLDRVRDGLYIKSKHNNMFVSERELDNVRK
nr:hypothetical protein [uncultured Cetobacterium sp.]